MRRVATMRLTRASKREGGRLGRLLSVGDCGIDLRFRARRPRPCTRRAGSHCPAMAWPARSMQPSPYVNEGTASRRADDGDDEDDCERDVRRRGHELWLSETAERSTMMRLDLSSVPPRASQLRERVAVCNVGDEPRPTWSSSFSDLLGALEGSSVLLRSAALHPVRLTLRVSESLPMGKVVS